MAFVTVPVLHWYPGVDIAFRLLFDVAVAVDVAVADVAIAIA